MDILKSVIAGSAAPPESFVIVSGIGQAGKIPHFIDITGFHSLHGRAIPIATGLKASNQSLTVIAEGGDGDMYGEGGNHFLHAIRRNPDIINIVHDNMVYGLTKGQASPTSEIGFVTPVQVNGVLSMPFNPVLTAVAMRASFVARAYAGHKKETAEMIRRAAAHKGFALVDILQPCVVFNKKNTYEWFENNTDYLPASHDTGDWQAAIKLASSGLRLGIFYEESRPSFPYDTRKNDPFKPDGKEKQIRSFIDLQTLPPLND